MEEKKSEKLNDKELDKVSGGIEGHSGDGKGDIYLAEDIKGYMFSPGSPTNNTLHTCPFCKFGAVHRPYHSFTKIFQDGQEVLWCHGCCRGFAFNEAGDLVCLGQG